MSSLNLQKIAQTVENYMLDEVVITRPGTPTMDNTTLAVTTPTTTVYDGKAMVAPQGSPALTDQAGYYQTVLMYEIGILADSDPMMPDDVVTVTTSVNNPDMEGKSFIVINEIPSTFMTHRRLTCKLKEIAE